ncbi:unnamed protein product [Penicillium olsonii]|nr:unnamed protein product [Penicillium olsonii]CAG8258296.1 unnamed protein product [Penicillium olsonii]
MGFQPTKAIHMLLVVCAAASSIIDCNEGFGTYYYDIEQVDSCGTTFRNQNKGGLMCSPAVLLSLDQINTNSVVAMNRTQLGLNPSLYCGKRVVVSVNGQPSDLQLFIGDGCERCSVGSSSSKIWNAESAPGLDFSYSVLDHLAGGNACNAGHIAISWEILDEKLYEFDESSLGLPFVDQPMLSNAVAVEPSVKCSEPSETPTDIFIRANAT